MSKPRVVTPGFVTFSVVLLEWRREPLFSGGYPSFMKVETVVDVLYSNRSTFYSVII